MLGLIAAVLIICWLLGLFAFHVTSGLIHIVLVVGLILLVLHFLTGEGLPYKRRRPLSSFADEVFRSSLQNHLFAWTEKSRTQDVAGFTKKLGGYGYEHDDIGHRHRRDCHRASGHRCHSCFSRCIKQKDCALDSDRNTRASSKKAGAGGRERPDSKNEKNAWRDFAIRPLAASDRERYIASWHKIQTEFVDDPKNSVTQADQLLGDVMSTRGYSVSEFEQRSADISVDHPLVVENYRAAHEIAVRHAAGQASTEDLRQAMIHYRTLFDELVGEPEMARAKAAGS